MTKGDISQSTYESFLGAFTGRDWVGYRPGSQTVDDRMLEMMAEEGIEGKDYTVCNNPDLFWASCTGRELRRRLDLAKKERKPENYYFNHRPPLPE